MLVRFLYFNVIDILINELRVTSSYPYKLHLLHELRITIYFSCTSYELLFPCEIRVTVYCTIYELILTYELRANFYVRVMSYFLTSSYNKDKDNKAVYDEKVMIKNYSLSHFLIKNLELAHFRVISI